MNYKWVKRISRAMVPCFVFFVFCTSFVTEVYAAESNISITYGAINYGSGTAQNSFIVYPTKDGTTPITNGQVGGRYSGNNNGPYTIYNIGPYIVTAGNVWHSGPAKLYFSYYPQGGTVVGNLGNLNAYQCWYDNSGGVRVSFTGADEITEYPVSASTTGKGYMVECSWMGSEGFPITRLAVNTIKGNGVDVVAPKNNYYTYYMTFPSIRLVTAESTAELDALDGVADELAKQSDLLVAMKGDIVAILQDIYKNTGDLETAANLMNSYLSTMVTHLNNIKNNTANINTTLGTIHTYMATMLKALETAIALNASTIEAAIAAQTAAMIAYLESVLNTGNVVPDGTYQQTQDAENILGQLEQLEKPNVDTIVPVIDDYSNGDFNGVLNAVFGSNLVMTMMTLSVSLAFGAYVLFGKRS